VLEIRLLGQFILSQDAKPIKLSARPAKTLLAYLLLTRDAHHPRERLAGLMWPDSDERNARKNLRQALWQLRKAIGDTYLQVDTRSIAFNSETDFWLDVRVLEDQADQDLEASVAVYEGELLPGFYEDWVLLERDRLVAAFDRKMQRLLTRLTHEQRWTEVLNWAEQWIAKGHIPESAYRSLMVAHAASGELSKVEAAYQRCVEALRQEIGVDPSEETRQLHEGLQAGEDVTRYLESEKLDGIDAVKKRQVILPPQPTRFIGRKEELAEMERLLSQTRLLTLTGPGGIGKTRLAVKAAAGSAGDFDHGCFFVALAPINAVEHIPQTIAEAVRFPLATQEDPQHQLLRHLEKRQLLLVIDNFEHLLDGVGIVNEMLQAAPGLKVLATSRERLNLQGETNFIVGGMDFPRPAGSDASGEYDAISLFVQSAKKVRPGYEPTAEDLSHIAVICNLVGGMPLAIELAAAWLHVLNVDEIIEELEKGLDILARVTRDAPERHRSIRAVFDHSWSLLSPAEQETFLFLSVFRGGFTRGAAHQVAGASLQLLAELVNKSFLSHDPNAARFEVHELLRQYAIEQLGKTPEAMAAAEKAHAGYYADFMQLRGRLLRGKRHQLALAEIEADIENVRAAWRYYLAKVDSTQLWRFITGVWHVYWLRWWNHAGMELFAEAELMLRGAKDEDTVGLRALAMVFQGYFMAWLGLAEQGYELAREGIDVLQQQDQPEALVLAYDSLVVNAYFLGRMSEETEAIARLMEIASSLDDEWLLAFAMFGAGMHAVMKGDHEKALHLAERGLKLYQDIGDLSGSTTPLIVMGHVAYARREFERAKGHYQRCLEIAEEVGFHYSTQTSTKYLAKVALSMGETAEANRHLVHSLRITQEIGFLRDIVNLLYEFSRLRAAQGNPEQAAELLALVIQHPASLQTRWLEGSIKGSAEGLLAKLEGELPAESYLAALERGRALELDKVVAALLESEDSRAGTRSE
jgi:predicted ATPase/DNA-binding SARP family transcriptional activator